MRLFVVECWEILPWSGRSEACPDSYIALAGCAPGACNTHRVLLLVRAIGSKLLARLDEGGFVHYYGYGSDDVTRNTAPLIVDSGLRAMRRGGSPYPAMS